MSRAFGRPFELLLSPGWLSKTFRILAILCASRTSVRACPHNHDVRPSPYPHQSRSLPLEHPHLGRDLSPPATPLPAFPRSKTSAEFFDHTGLHEVAGLTNCPSP